MKYLKLSILFLFITFSTDLKAEILDDVIRKLETIESRLTVLEKATFNQTTSEISSNNLSNYESIIAKQSIQIIEIQNEIQELTSQLEEILFSMQTTINTFNSFKEDTQFQFDDFKIEQAEILNQVEQESLIINDQEKIEENDLEPKVLGTIELNEDGVQNLSLQEPITYENGEDSQDVINTIAQDNLVKLEEKPIIISILPEGTEIGQYEFSMNLLKQGDYETAEKAFKEYIHIGTDEQLLSNSNFWLAGIFYAREDYKSSANEYLTLYQKYPDSIKAPEALLKLGISLIRIDQKEQACITFLQLQQDYPMANQSLVDRNLLEIKNNNCESS